MEQLRFDGRAAIVTGAGRGIGRAHALLLASRGAKVVVADYGGAVDGTGSSSGPAEEVAEEIRAAGGDAVACCASVAEEEGAALIVDTAMSSFGRLDIVVNNAGISDKHLFGDLTSEQFRRMMDVHFFGTLYVTKAAWPHLVEVGNGRIVNTITRPYPPRRRRRRCHHRSENSGAAQPGDGAHGPRTGVGDDGLPCPRVVCARG
jgi:NAD(P)-dependent dehydrogenase (short-subunit alcohol dehydrogenase family)